jgi:hypothetical protein
MPAEGWLRFFAARLDGEIKAVQYGYLYRRTFLQMQEGFDLDTATGLGNALRNQVIEHCIVNGVTAYDFLAGYTDNKRRWGVRLRLGHAFFVIGPEPQERPSAPRRALADRPVFPPRQSPDLRGPGRQDGRGLELGAAWPIHEKRPGSC